MGRKGRKERRKCFCLPFCVCPKIKRLPLHVASLHDLGKRSGFMKLVQIPCKGKYVLAQEAPTYRHFRPLSWFIPSPGSSMPAGTVVWPKEACSTKALGLLPPHHHPQFLCLLSYMPTGTVAWPIEALQVLYPACPVPLLLCVHVCTEARAREEPYDLCCALSSSSTLQCQQGQ